MVARQVGLVLPSAPLDFLFSSSLLLLPSFAPNDHPPLHLNMARSTKKSRYVHPPFHARLSLVLEADPRPWFFFFYRTIIVKLFSAALTGSFFVASRPRISPKLAMMRHDPKSEPYRPYMSSVRRGGGVETRVWNEEEERKGGRSEGHLSFLSFLLDRLSPSSLSHTSPKHTMGLLSTNITSHHFLLSFAASLTV